MWGSSNVGQLKCGAAQMWGSSNVRQFRCEAVQMCSAVTAICKRDNMLQERPGQRTRKQVQKSKDREVMKTRSRGASVSNCQPGLRIAQVI